MKPWCAALVTKKCWKSQLASTNQRQKLRGESVCRIIEMNVKVAGDDEFMRCGCSEGQKRTELIEECNVM